MDIESCFQSYGQNGINELSLQQVSESSGIDATLLCKIESGKRVATTEQLLNLAYVYELAEVVSFLNTADTDIEIKAIQAAETKTAYGSPYLSLFMKALYSKPIALESRRYIGSKAKLVGWIMMTFSIPTTSYTKPSLAMAIMSKRR